LNSYLEAQGLNTGLGLTPTMHVLGT